MTRTGVSAHLSAAHRGADGQIHGHTWKVRAWFQAGTDALLLQAHLRAALSRLDHTLLPDELASGEAMAQAIGATLDRCLAVEISREAEGIYATWQPDELPCLPSGGTSLGRRAA